MKNNIKFLLFCFLLITPLIFISCKYDIISDAEYPDQIIYMPAAYYNIFNINEIAKPIGNTTPGNNYRYKVDVTNNKFIIPLAIYRAGIDNKGSFNVDIFVDNDTIKYLQMPDGELMGTELLTSDKYTLPTSVTMEDKMELAPFDLSLNLDSLLVHFSKNTIFALAVGISSAERDINPNLSTTILSIDTKIMKPTAEYSYIIDSANSKNVIFTNNSEMSLSYEWEFGDGSKTNEYSPSHTYTSPGTYTVSLKAIGITGEQDSSIKEIIVTIL